MLTTKLQLIERIHAKVVFRIEKYSSFSCYSILEWGEVHVRWQLMALKLFMTIYSFSAIPSIFDDYALGCIKCP